MKYWISLVNTVEIDQFCDIARNAEELGYAGISVPDHLAYPVHIQTPYPYTEDGKVWWPNTNPWPDPWITVTAMGMVTSRLRFATNIYLAALRDPFTAARAVAAAAIFTNQRVACGVAAGWLKEEFDLLGIDMKTRGRRLDEVLHCMGELNSGAVVSHQGEFFQYQDVIMSPVPSEPVPIWVGGLSPPALRRAANHDGWLGLPMDNAQTVATVNELFALRRANGKYAEPFDVFLSGMEPVSPDFVAALDPAGRYHATVFPWTPSPWGRAFWVKEDEDHRQLEVKIRAMTRCRAMMEKLKLWQ